MATYPQELYATFPDGIWRFEIRGVALMDFEGKHVFPTEHGVFFRHPPTMLGQEWRTSYFPWHKVERAYTVKEGQSEQSTDNGAGNGLAPDQPGTGSNSPGNRGGNGPGEDSGSGGDKSTEGKGSTD